MRRVVVTGIGTVNPIGNDAKAYWQALITGKNGIGELTRFDAGDYKVSLAAEVKDFDPLQYFEKNEIRKTDLFVQYGLASATQAMADSGIEGAVDPERLGVYFGSGVGGMITMSTEIGKLNEKGLRRVSPHFTPMMMANAAGANIAIRFGAKGANIPVVTACATSANTIGEAYRAIRHGYLDAIIAGGAEAVITPIALGGFGNMTALTTSDDPDAASIPFDLRRSGFVMGEGAGTLILEDYEHAKNRGAKMYGELCGYGTTGDAYHETAPDPDAKQAARSITLCMEEAGLTPENLIYINAHGTSTPLNDAMETKAVKLAFGGKTKNVLISSTKSMTGHALGAAGAIEGIAALLAVKEGIVPPTIGYREPDPELDLDYVPNEARRIQVDAALSTSFGFGGHNACLVFRKVEDVQ